MIKYILILIIVIQQTFTFAQSNQFLEYGSNILETLESSFDTDVFRFEGLKGDRIWINANDANNGVDVCFRLKKGIEILKEIRGDGGHVELFDFVLPDTGFYDIEIYDNNYNDHGAYGLSLQKLNDPAYARQISCGDDLFDTIKSVAAIMVYQFDVQAGDVAFAQMRGTNQHLESTLFLFNQRGDLLHKSVRKANTYAFIEDIKIDSSEKYSLFAFDDNGNDIGSFGMTYQDLNDPTCGNQKLQCADYLEAVIRQEAETHAYNLDLKSNDGFVIKMMAPNKSFEASASVHGPSGELIVQQIVTAKANDLVVPQVNSDGIYTILINDDRANDTSKYYLAVNQLSINCAEELSLCQVVRDSFDVLSDLNLYYFYMPDQSTSIEIKEIDPVIEFFASVIYDGTHTNYKDNVKLNLQIFEPTVGSLVFLALSDNGANDIGRYKITSLNSENFQGSPPVAITKQDLTFNIPPSGLLQISSKDLDDGSYDDCEIIDMTVQPSSFDCTMLGPQEIQFIVTDNDGLSASILTKITIKSDLALEIDNCGKLDVSEYREDLCLPVEANATGGSGTYEFYWSNNTTGSNTMVCPEDAADLSCKLIDANGCETKKLLWLPIGENIFCDSNGKKITLCHIPMGNPDTSHELCVSVNSLIAHFGHGDYVGPCNQGCDGEIKVLSDGQETSMGENIVLSGVLAVRGEMLHLKLDDWEDEEESGQPLQVELINTLGQILYREQVQNLRFLDLQLPSGESSFGLHYLFIRRLDGKAKQLTIPILVQ